MTTSTIFQKLSHWAAWRPQVIALIHDERAVTYRDLASKISQMVDRLSSANLRFRSTIAIEAHKTVETIALIAALEHLRHPVLLLSPHIGAHVKQAIYRTTMVDAEIARVFPELSISRLNNNPELRTQYPDEEDIAFILMTSGSTGTPKGVKLPRVGVQNFFSWSRAYFEIGPGKTTLSYAPLNFDLSLLEVWAALDSGATVVLVGAEQAADGQSLRSLLQNHRPHFIQGVPILFRLLLDDPLFSYPINAHIAVTGEATSKSLRQSIVSAFPAGVFHNIYGSTETNDSFIYSADANQFACRESLPIGRPIATTQYKILNEHGNLVEREGLGELHASTPFAALGYTDPKLTVRSFYSEGGRIFYRTGDLVERNSAGEIYILGRQDHVVKVRGVRTNLRDIEIALERHSGVKRAVVCPLKDEADNLFLHALVQIRPDSRVSALALRKHCAQTLPRSAIPGRFSIDSSPLPLTATGKPDRTAIKKALERQKVLDHA